MSKVLISGDLSLEDIEATIQSMEVNRNRFVGAEIDGDDNRCQFVRQRVPPRARLVLAGRPPPSGTTLDWSGSLRVAGEEQDVELFRGASAAAP